MWLVLQENMINKISPEGEKEIIYQTPPNDPTQRLNYKKTKQGYRQCQIKTLIH